jgi:hypothetical protein
MAHTAQQLVTPYPVIDTDPHFFRVIRYTRASDWLYAAGLTAGFPGAMMFWERREPSTPKGALPSVMRMSWTLGAIGGFLLAYSRSSQRFWGWAENEREQEKDMQEMKGRVAAGLKPYGESELSPYMQGVAARNSTFSGLFVGLMPWYGSLYRVCVANS